MQIRGTFDGKNIQGKSYNQLLKELCEDFGMNILSLHCTDLKIVSNKTVTYTFYDYLTLI